MISVSGAVSTMRAPRPFETLVTAFSESLINVCRRPVVDHFQDGLDTVYIGRLEVNMGPMPASGFRLQNTRYDRCLMSSTSLPRSL